jgi:ectoine hydroxylase-related dioxygenase (phytanoyl-CoA dioxygenase family)
MELNLDQQKRQLMRNGYVIVRNMIPSDELEQLRESVDIIVEKAPPSSRVTVTDWVDRQTANTVEFYFDDRVFDFSYKLMNAPDAAPLGMWVLCHSGTGWHRDIHPIDMAPLDGLQEDIRLNGPPYVQWNLALYDDSYLYVIPGSHLRRNNAAESKVERRLDVVSLPGATPVDLKAGDGIVYINSILHSATPNGDSKRRTLHFGYQGFGGEGFMHFFLPATMGVEFVEHLSPWAAEKYRHFEGLHVKRHDDVAFTLCAILEKNEHAFAEGLS